MLLDLVFLYMLILEMVGPVDVADLPKATVMEGVYLAHAYFHYSPTFRAIQKH